MKVSSEVQLRVIMGHFLSDIAMWSKGYEEISPQLLDRLLQILHDAIVLTDDTDTAAKLQKIVDELEQLQLALFRSELRQESYFIAQKIVEEVHTIRDAGNNLQSVDMTKIVGKHVISLDTTFRLGVLVSNIEAFKRAIREDRDTLIGDVVIRPADEQQVMTELFTDIYLSEKRSLPQVNTFYLCPTDFPTQTFQKPDKQLVRIRWERTSQVRRRANIWSTLKYDRDERIGMRVYHAQKEIGGLLNGMRNRDTWIIAGDDGKGIIDKSSRFWLLSGTKGETIADQYPLLLNAKRVLAEQDIYNITVDAPFT